MKVEIKEIKKERQDGFYKVKYENKFEVAQYECGEWWVICVENSQTDRDFQWIDKSPIIFGNEIVEYESKFEPFELSLTIESKGELQELWHKMNMCISRFKDFNGYGVGEYQYSFNGDDKQISSIIWAKLNEIMKGRNIKP